MGCGIYRIEFAAFLIILSNALFSGIACAAPAGTQPTAKVTSAPAPVVKTPAVAAPVKALQPKANVQVPVQKIPPATSIKQPPGIVSQQPVKALPQPVSPVSAQPKVNVKIPNLPQGPKQNLHPQIKPGTIPPPRPVYNPARPQVGPEINTPNVGNAMVRPKIDPQTLNRIQQFQEAATTAETLKQIEELNRAQQERMQFGNPAQPGVEGAPVGGPQIGGNQPAQRESINDIFNRGASGFGGGSQGLQPRGLGYNSMGQQQPSAGGLGTSKASGDSVLKPVVDSVRNFVENGVDGERDGTASQATRIILGAPVIGAAIFSAATVQAALDIINDPKNIHPLLGAHVPDPLAPPQPAPANPPSDPPTSPPANPPEGVDTDGDGVPDSSPPPSPESQPNESGQTGKDDCNWNPIYGRCMNQRTIKDSIDSTRQPSRGEASTGNGTSYPVVGPDAVTDYEHGHRGANNRGQSVIEINPDPPEDIDNQMGTLE